MKKLIIVLTAGMLFLPSLVSAHCNAAAYQDALDYAKTKVMHDRRILSGFRQSDKEQTRKVSSLLYEIYAFSDAVSRYLGDNEINYSNYTCEERAGADELAGFILERITPLVDAVRNTSLDEESRDVLIRHYLNLDNYAKGFVLSEFLYDFKQHLFTVDEESTAVAGWDEFIAVFNKAVYGEEDYSPSFAQSPKPPRMPMEPSAEPGEH